MKVGVIGCGGMGTTHYLSLKALSAKMDLQVVALADCRKEFLDKAAACFPGVHTYENGMDLIAGEKLDIVHICLPSYMHTDHVIAAMNRGMNAPVFRLKPVSGPVLRMQLSVSREIRILPSLYIRKTERQNIPN